MIIGLLTGVIIEVTKVKRNYVELNDSNAINNYLHLDTMFIEWVWRLNELFK